MANKITIRRVGGLLPAMSLVALILLASLIIWLSTVGLPQCTLRRIEAEAAKQGIYLKVDRLKLSPASGLAVRARRVELYAAAGEEKPLATLERATLAISASALLRGQLQPTKAEFRNLDLALPTDGEAPLVVADASASATIHNGRHVRLTSASARLEGIPVTLRGAFMLPESSGGDTTTAADSAPLDLTALLRPLQEPLGQVQRSIAAQNWSPDELPEIELQLMALRQTQLSARVTIPRYDEEQFHFRDASLDIAYQHNTVLINKIHFRTVEPESEVTLQGGYDILARHLSVNLESTAALTRMAEALTIPGADMEEIVSWLRRFRHPDDAPPSIALRGDVYFEENFSPRAISLTGQVSQKNFVFGETAIDELHLSFYYRDGSFNIDRLHLAFPTGSLTLSASASSETNKGKARIMADLDIPHLLTFANEFTTEPLTLPEGLELTGNLQLDAAAELDMPSFISGATNLDQFLPTLHRVELSVGIDKAAHYGHSMEQPQLKLIISDMHQPEGELIPNALSQAELSFHANAVHLPREEGKDEGTSFHKAELELVLRGLSLEESPEAPAPHITSADGELHLGALSLPGFRAEAVNLKFVGAEDIRPLADNWRRILKQATLRLTTGAMHTGETLLGAADSKIELDADGNLDLAAVLDRDGHRMHLELHPQLTEDGILVLEQVQLELPAAGFAPLLALTGTDITQIRMPDLVTLSGSVRYDTRSGSLRQAAGELSIPHLVRTPGAGVLAFKGREVPLSVSLKGHAQGQEDGNTTFGGELRVIHKTERKGARERKLELSFTGDTASHVHLEGTSTLDVGTADELIDLYDAHVIMRDFRTHEGSVTDIDIRSVDVNWAGGLTVTASCDARINDIGYQLFSIDDVLNAQGKPTGKETVRTDLGKDPYRQIEKARAHVDVLYKENAEGKIEATRISILNADVTYDNRPWLRSQGFKKGVKSSRLQGEAVIIDVEDSFVELRNVHGQAYPAYAIGAYYADLQGFLNDVILEQPARVETKRCLFPIGKDCPHPFSGSIRMEADRAGFRFLGTTFPFTNFSGFIWFRDGAVCLDRLNAACWDGAVNAALTIDYSGKHTGFDGYATFDNINLKPLAAAYGSKQQPALCNGNIRFRTPTPEVRDLQAYGEVHIVNGDLMSLRIFRPVGDLITDLPGNLAELERKALRSEGREPNWFDRQLSKIFQKTGDTISNVGNTVTNNIPFANHFLRYDLQEVHSRFNIGRGKLVTDGMKALGYNLNVGMQLELDLDKLTLEGDLWPKISSVPTLILSPITFLSDFMIDIQVFGPVDDIDWKFGLNRKRKEEQDECSVTDEAPKQNMKPKKR